MDRKAATLTAMCLAVLMVQLDTTVVNLALKPMQTNLHVGVSTLQWVVDAYNVVYATFILTGAILGDRFGRKKLFLFGVALFGLGSVVSAVSPGAGVLVLSRVVTGFGAAIALPISLSIVSATYADEKARNRAIGIWSGINGVAIAVGPSAGGVLVDRFGWRAIFVMFLPVVIAAFVLTLTAVAESKSEEARGLDWRGQSLAVATLGLFTFGAIEGPALHWNALIVTTLAASVAAFAGFILVERRSEQPLVQLDMFRNANFAGALVVTLVMTFGMYSFLFIIPNYLQTVTKFSALTTGLLLLPQGVFFAALSPFVGHWMGVVGPRRMIVLGMGLQAAGFLTTLALGVHGPVWLVIVQTTLLGLALGCETGPLMSVAMAAVPKDRFGMPSGVVNVVRLTGATLGVAVLGSIFAVHAGATADAATFLAGTRVAMVVAAATAVLAIGLALVALRRPATRTAHGEGRREGVPRPVRRAYSGRR
jgi:MFS transporter, DHA2 family, methylenomycin A resistance protein